MDSVLEEDVTLPGTRSGCSGLALGAPDDPEGISPDPGSGNGVLPNVSEEKVSPTRARNMKDFENQITELKKENFNLKLRIYFLEESLQRERGGRTERACKTNIELKVEVESLKRELQERERLLIKASKSLLRARVMDFITSTAILPLLLGCVGLFSLFKLLQWLRMRAYIRNAVVVITGATSGLGRECARVFHAAGARLVLCGRNAEALEELSQELAASRAPEVQTHKPCTVTFDLADPGAIAGAASEILQCFGHVDVLINNAGISYRGAIVDTSPDVDKRVMETNYFGPVALTKALLPAMIRRRQGHVVAISSIQGKISLPFRSAYAASKHATQAFFDCLRAEVEQHDIEVTVISPGYIHTNLSLNAVTADGSKYGVMDETTAQGRSPVQVAQDILAALGKKKKDVVLADPMPSLAVYLRTLAPGLFFRLMASRARKERKSKHS